MASFSALYDSWRADGRQNVEIGEELKKAYRDAWKSGGIEDRYAVVSFLFLSRDPTGFDIFGEAMRDESENLAIHALALTTALIWRGFDMDPGVRRSLEEFGSRRPEWESISEYAIRLLTGRSNATSRE